MSLFRLNETRPPRSKFAPQLEALEDRCVPTLNITQVGSTLNIVGRHSEVFGLYDHVVTINDNGNGDLTITGSDLSGAITPRTFNDITKITFDFRWGNSQRDVITYNQNGNRTRDMSIDGWRMPGPLGLPAGGLGAGDDTFTANIYGDINASRSLSLLMWGDGGRDTISVNATQDVDIQQGARMAVTLDGGDDSDNVWLSYRGELDGNLWFAVDGGAGDDGYIWSLGTYVVRQARVTASVTADSGSTGILGSPYKGGIPAVVHGGEGNDVVSFAVYGSLGTLNVLADGDGSSFSSSGANGNDYCYHTANVPLRSVEASSLLRLFDPRLLEPSIIR